MDSGPAVNAHDTQGDKPRDSETVAWDRLTRYRLYMRGHISNIPHILVLAHSSYPLSEVIGMLASTMTGSLDSLRLPGSRQGKSLMSIALVCALLVTHGSVQGREPHREHRPGRSFLGLKLALLQQDTGVAAKVVTVQTLQASQSQPPAIQPNPGQPDANQTDTTGIPPNFENARQLLASEQFAEAWLKYSAEAPSQETWVLQELENETRLICSGKPYGYLRTRKRFKNFHLKFEWRYPDGASGNSGVLLNTQGEDMIWPQAIQVQLQHSKAGSIFPIGGAKSNQAIQVQKSAYVPHQWNECLISSQNGTVTVTVNGVKQGEVTGCEPASGHIALQSEGSPVQFRRIQLVGQPDEPELATPKEGVVQEATPPQKNNDTQS